MQGASPHSDSLSDTTLVILAGGEGSRMGKPKAELTLDGVPILEYLLDHFGWPGSTMLVTAPGREHPPGCQRFTVEASDPIAGGGPLRGILTALEHVHTPLLLLLTVDMPAIRIQHCEPLLEHLRQYPQSLGVMMRRGSGQIEPFPCALRLSAKSVIQRRLKEARHSVHGLLEEPGFAVIDAKHKWPDSVWSNLNSPADVQRFQP